MKISEEDEKLTTHRLLVMTLKGKFYSFDISHVINKEYKTEARKEVIIDEKSTDSLDDIINSVIE